MNMNVNFRACHYFLDHLYGAVVHRMRLAPPFFSEGWGGAKLEMLERMAKHMLACGLADVSARNWPPKRISPMWKTVWENKYSRLHEGIFMTPCDPELVDVLPVQSHTARVAFLTPKNVPPHQLSCVVHLAGTGDHSFVRRLRLGTPLLKDNIATMVLESPYYGNRRPPSQHGAKLLCVSDLLMLGRATIEEARSLLYWLQTEAGFNKTGVCGLSMGGVHAAMVGSLHQTPVATLPFLAPHSAAVAFCEGILKHGTAWDALQKDIAHNSGKSIEEVRERMRSVLSLTDVTQFPVPKCPSAVIFVAATDDGYIPKQSALQLQKAWPGSEVRWVTGGHVSSFILHGDSFRLAIKDAIDRLP